MSMYLNGEEVGAVIAGGITEEVDPTVPQYVKDITEQDIANWNNKLDKDELDNYYTKTESDERYIQSFEESDPTVPQYVKNITQQDIESWNNKADSSSVEAIQERVSQQDDTITDISDKVSSLEDKVPTEEERKKWNSASKVTLNGEETGDASFYAPTESGNAGQILQSNGEGVSATWINIPEGGQTTYDLVIKTQEEFEKWYKTLDDGTCEASSILLVGDGGNLEFIRNDGKGLHLPLTLYTIDGTNNAIINIANLEQSQEAIKYPTRITDTDHYIRNITAITSTPKVSPIVFHNCANLANCSAFGWRGFNYCTNLVNCDASSDTNGSGFYMCNNLIGCTAGITQTPSGYYNAFSQCNLLTNCTGYGHEVLYSGNATAFILCKQLVNCIGTGVSLHTDGYGFGLCSYLSNCKEGSTPSTTGLIDSDCKYVDSETVKGLELATKDSIPRPQYRIIAYQYTDIGSIGTKYTLTKTHITPINPVVAAGDYVQFRTDKACYTAYVNSVNNGDNEVEVTVRFAGALPESYLPLTGGTVSGATTFSSTLGVSGVATFNNSVKIKSWTITQNSDGSLEFNYS